nr:putative cyclic nucleotide-gated ion channel 8 [Ipomoea batatas]
MAGKTKCAFSIEGVGAGGHPPNSSMSIKLGMIRGSEGLMTFGRSLKSGVTRAVFPEDLKVSEKKIFDPQDKSLLFWNRLLVISCIFSVSVDPLFLYLLVFNSEDNCLQLDTSLAYTTTTLRTLIDSFYLIRMVLQFRTAYIAPSSRVFGRGELVIDPKQIASRYIHRYFVIDLLSILPLPQIVVWRFLHGSKGSDVLATKKALVLIIILQYIPRFLRFIPLTSELKKTAGVFAETAWAGAAYYMLWFVLVSHIFGALWYLLAVERKDACWADACRHSEECNGKFSLLYCMHERAEADMTAWRNITHEVLEKNCAATDDSPFNYGIYAKAVSSGVVDSEDFITKYCYCLCTLGQGLQTSTYPLEVLFSIALAILGLLLFSLLIGNMQTYLQSITVRLEEMRIKRRDSEQWMHHRVLPPELRERVRRYEQFKWLETRGVDEESLVQNLPKDLRRDIKRHLCLNLVRRKTHTSFEKGIQSRRCSSSSGGGWRVSRQTVEEAVSSTESDFCGEELLTWALDPKAGSNLPPSTRTVQALSEVEAFALIADEVKFITTQFRRIHSRQVQHTFRFYSQQWRTWAAVFIQAAWRRHMRRKISEALISTGLRTTMLASRFANNALRKKRQTSAKLTMKPPKPPEPDFGDD